MNPLDPDLESLIHQWFGKADNDPDAAEQLAPKAAERHGRREIIGQQCVEKYLKASLTYHQVEFPKTHDIKELAHLVSRVNREAAEAMIRAKWLSLSALTSATPVKPRRCSPATTSRPSRLPVR